MEWYEMLDEKRKVVILDCETGGLTPDCAITSVAAVMVDEDLNIVRSVYTIVNDPGREIGEKALEITGFTKEYIAEWGVSPAELARVLTPILADADVIVGHNVNFDVDFLLSYGFDVGNTPLLDTMHLSWDVWPYPQKARLGMVCDRIGVDASGAHNSYDDVIMTLELLKWFVLNGHVSKPLPSYPCRLEQEKGWFHGYNHMRAQGALDEYEKDK